MPLWAPAYAPTPPQETKSLLEDTKERQYSLEECFACFKRLLLQHSVHRPPFSVEVFSQEDVENITSYVLHR